jgi:hypothetical protein
VIDIVRRVFGIDCPLREIPYTTIACSVLSGFQNQLNEAKSQVSYWEMPVREERRTSAPSKTILTPVILGGEGRIYIASMSVCWETLIMLVVRNRQLISVHVDRHTSSEESIRLWIPSICRMKLSKSLVPVHFVNSSTILCKWTSFS